jgi:hypothetical protein
MLSEPNYSTLYNLDVLRGQDVKYSIGILDDRKPEKYNRIPHITPMNIKKEKWVYSYENHLLTMYDIVEEVIKEQYPKNKTKWSDHTSKKKLFNGLTKLLYHCSSKYITPYLDSNLDSFPDSEDDITDC